MFLSKKLKFLKTWIKYVNINNVTIFKEQRPSTDAPRYKKTKKESTAVVKLKRVRKQRQVWTQEMENQPKRKKKKLIPRDWMKLKYDWNIFYDFNFLHFNLCWFVQKTIALELTANKNKIHVADLSFSLNY